MSNNSKTGAFTFSLFVNQDQSGISTAFLINLIEYFTDLKFGFTEGPHIMRILGLQKKTALCEIYVNGNVGGPLLTQKSPTCGYIDQNCGSRGPR